MAAAAAVFDTYELLENIMLHLPLVDILTATRVCSTWRAVFEQSMQVRRLLFESELPGCDTDVEGILVNAHKKSPWIFRTDTLIGRQRQTARLFIYSTLKECYTILCPQESTKPLVSSCLRFNVSPVGVHGKTGWVVEWGTSDGSLWGIHRVDLKSSTDAEEFEEWLKTFYNDGHFSLSRRNAPRIGLGLQGAMSEWCGETVIFGNET